MKIEYSKPLVIVACGQAKQTAAAMAGELYTGSYFRACLAYARALAPDSNIFILSAKYGFLCLTDVIEPYDVTMRDSSRIGVIAAIRQGESLGMRGCIPVVLGGQRYVKLCSYVFRQIEQPLHGVGGLGKQIAWLRTHAKR